MGGKSGGSTVVKTPKPPKPPPPPPKPIKAAQKAAAKRGFDGRGTAENIRNEGGGRGVPTSSALLAKKGLMKDE